MTETNTLRGMRILTVTINTGRSLVTDVEPGPEIDELRPLGLHGGPMPLVEDVAHIRVPPWNGTIARDWGRFDLVRNDTADPFIHVIWCGREGASDAAWEHVEEITIEALKQWPIKVTKSFVRPRQFPWVATIFTRHTAGMPPEVMYASGGLLHCLTAALVGF